MGIRLKDIDPFKAYNNWIAGTADFRCFFRSTNFVSLKNYPDFELCESLPETDETIERTLKLIEDSETEGTFVILDLPGSTSICAAYQLQAKLNIKPVLIFNGILHPLGLICDKGYISRLMGCSLMLESGEYKSHALVLDSMRYGDYSDEELKKFFNNQYELGEDDLPSADMLMELGYKEILFIYESAVKEDIDSYLSYISGAGIPVSKKDCKESKE